MADPHSQLDPGPLNAATKLGKGKDVEDSISSPLYVDSRQTKTTNLLESLAQKSKVDYSGNPKEVMGVPSKLLKPSFAHGFQKDLKKLDLSGHGLTELPPNLIERCCENEIEELNLSNNPLTDSGLHLIRMRSLKKLDVSGCGLKEFPCTLMKISDNLQELNLSNNMFEHQDLLEKLNSETKFTLNEREFLGPRGNGLALSRIIFEDAIYIKRGGVWAKKAREDAAPKEETWLDEFCRIRKSEEFTIETYHSMIETMKILATLGGDNVENLNLKSCCFKIQRYLDNIKATGGDPDDRNNDLHRAIFYLKKAVSSLINDAINLKPAMEDCALTCKDASHCSSTKDMLLVAELKIISKIMSNLTEPEAAIPWSLQFLQHVHDQPEIQEVFSSLDSKESDSVMLFAKSVFKMNKILFEFVQAFFKPPPTVEEWPVTIQLLDKSIYNPLIDKRLMDTENVVSRETKLDIHKVDNRIQNPSTDVAECGFMITESCKQTPDMSITVDQKGGCFSLPEVCAFLLFPPNAVDEKVTLKCCRVKHKDCKLKLSNGEVFVSRILKIEPEGVTFKKPVTVLMSHSLDEDENFLYFYELIVENFSRTGNQELKTGAISSIKDVPNEICNKEVLYDYLPLAKATIQETCTLAAATRARFNQILIPTNRRYVFRKKYGDIAELKITFPAGVTKEILSLKVQLFPADAVLNKDIRLNKSLVCAPIIRVSGQKTSFLEPVDVELTYSHSDVANIEEEFLPVGKTIQFTTEYGLLLRNHNETKSKSYLQALNESNDVSVERSRKNKLKFSFSVKHFSDVQPVVKTSAVSYLPPTNTGMVSTNNPACHHAIVLAVHDTDSSPKTLRAVLAPKFVKRDLQSKWKVEPLRFMNRLKREEPIYFCVPISDTKESESLHLYLEDYTLWFDPDDESELSNSTADAIKCNNGENHTTQGDCRAKFPIHTFESRSVLQAGSEGPEISQLQDRILPKECNVSSDQEDAPKSVNEMSKVILRRCKSFENTVESLAEEKLKINEASLEDPKGGKATKFVDVAGPVATVICTLAGGITVAMSFATFGATSFATALVAGAVFAVKIVDKHKIQAKAKVVKDVVNAANEKSKVSSYLNCVVKDVARELSRIFEYQLLRLENDEQIKILAECAVDLMLDLKKDDTFDRNTLLKKVLQDGNMKKKKKLATEIKNKKWLAPDVFRKPGLRRIVFRKDGVKFEYFVKPDGDCDVWMYGYRGEFLELKKYDCQNNNGEKPRTDQAPPTDEEPSNDFCKKCSGNYENNPSGHYFGKSDIDAKYIDCRREPSTYFPLHILIQCPNVLDYFQQLAEKKPSFASFVRLGLPAGHKVRPVYRPHSPGKVSDLRESDLSGSDFSYCDFTGSCLQNCNFNDCVMLFTNATQAKMSDSTFCGSYISHCNFKEVEAHRCKWIGTHFVYSFVDDACGLENLGGNSVNGTNVSQMNFNN